MNFSKRMEVVRSSDPQDSDEVRDGQGSICDGCATEDLRRYQTVETVTKVNHLNRIRRKDVNTEEISLLNRLEERSPE